MSINHFLFFLIGTIFVYNFTNCANTDTKVYTPIIETDKQQLYEGNKIEVVSTDGTYNTSDNIVGLIKRSDVFEVTIEVLSHGELNSIDVVLSDKDGKSFELGNSGDTILNYLTRYPLRHTIRIWLVSPE